MTKMNLFGYWVLTLCREAISTGDLGLAGLTALERSTFLHQYQASSAVDGPVHWRREEDSFRLSYTQLNSQQALTGLQQAPNLNGKTSHFLLLRELSPPSDLFSLSESIRGPIKQVLKLLPSFI